MVPVDELADKTPQFIDEENIRRGRGRGRRRRLRHCYQHAELYRLDNDTKMLRSCCRRDVRDTYVRRTFQLPAACNVDHIVLTTLHPTRPCRRRRQLLLSLRPTVEMWCVSVH